MDVSDLLPDPNEKELPAASTKSQSASPTETEGNKTTKTNSSPQGLQEAQSASPKGARTKAAAKPPTKKQMADPDMVRAFLDGCETQAEIMATYDQWKARLTEKEADEVVKYAGQLVGNKNLPVE
jgi:hypothetical protein